MRKEFSSSGLVLDVFYICAMFYILFLAKKHGVSNMGSNICGLVSHATQERLTNIMEKLSIFSLHRLETMKVRKYCHREMTDTQRRIL